MTTVTATVVANFRGADSGATQFDAEIDSRDDGFNLGKTSFGPGDRPAFLVRRSPNVTITNKRASVGIVSTVALGLTEEVTEFLQFDDTNVATLSQHALTGTLTFKWMGTSLGGLNLVGVKEVQAGSSGVAVAQVTYTTSFDAFRVDNIPVPLNGETTFPVLIVVDGTEN